MSCEKVPLQIKIENLKKKILWSPSETIASLIDSVKTKFKIIKPYSVLIHANAILDSSQSLSHYNIIDSSKLLELICSDESFSKLICVCIDCQPQHISLSSVPINSTISSLRVRLENQIKNLNEFNFVFDEKVLREDKALLELIDPEEEDIVLSLVEKPKKENSLPIRLNPFQAQKCEELKKIKKIEETQRVEEMKHEETQQVDELKQEQSQKIKAVKDHLKIKEVKNEEIKKFGRRDSKS